MKVFEPIKYLKIIIDHNYWGLFVLYIIQHRLCVYREIVMKKKNRKNIQTKIKLRAIILSQINLYIYQSSKMFSTSLAY